MLDERNIKEEWVWRTINTPDFITKSEKGITHYFRNISEHNNRTLHIIINMIVSPHKIITVFFDRRIRSELNEIETK